MADQKLTALTEQAPATTDILYVVHNPGGTPVSKKCLVSDVLALAGDVTGPGSATDGNLVVFDGTTGKLVKDGGPPGGAGGGGIVEFISATTPLSGASVEIDSIGSTHYMVRIVLVGVQFSASSVTLRLQFKTAGGVQSSNYAWNINAYNASGNSTPGTASDSSIRLMSDGTSGTVFSGEIVLYEPFGANSKQCNYQGISRDLAGQAGFSGGATWTGSAALTAIVLSPSTGTFSGGSVYIWGFNIT
jgi:hypothetical protein